MQDAKKNKNTLGKNENRTAYYVNSAKLGLNLSPPPSINFKTHPLSGFAGEMADIKITLETLYDILRNEKKREDLQKLEATFFIDVVQYLREKQALLESKRQSTEVFAAGERDKLEYELRSIIRILKEIYEKREKKIIDITLNKSRTGSDLIDTSALLHEEREFYQILLRILDDFRQGILQNLSQGKLPHLFEQQKLEAVAEKKKEAAFPTFTSPLLSAAPASPNPAAFTRIKFILPLPSFVWKDMKQYGPFDVGEELEIYPEVADLIVRKGRAVKV